MARPGRKTLPQHVGLTRPELRRAYRARAIAKPKVTHAYKNCCRCFETKDATCFNEDQSAVDGRAGHCKTCAAKERRSRRAIQTAYQRKRRYGLTPDAFDSLMQQQRGLCPLCDRALAERKRIVVDHDHTTGAVRGLLCDRCNLWLRAIEKPGFVRAALEYLANEPDGPIGRWSYQRKAAASTLHARQGGVCVLCPRPVVHAGKGSAAVDHDHRTGCIRGLLCIPCNLYLKAVEDIEWRRRAESYVQAA